MNIHFSEEFLFNTGTLTQKFVVDTKICHWHKNIAYVVFRKGHLFQVLSVPSRIGFQIREEDTSSQIADPSAPIPYSLV